jgi:hypothetical protein
MIDDKLSGDGLRQLMRTSAITVSELADKAALSPDSINDYLRPSRTVSRDVLKAVRLLEDSIEDRLQSARDHLLTSYRNQIGRPRNFPGTDLPRLDVGDLEPFIHLREGSDLKKAEILIPFKQWTEQIRGQFAGWYNRDQRRNAAGVILLGEPGIGKTTCLRLLISSEDVFKFCTPVVLPLHLLNETHLKNLDDAILAHMAEFHWTNRLPELREFLRLERDRKRLLYVLDGFDELGSIAARLRVITLVQQLTNPYLLSSRPTRPDLSSSSMLATTYSVASFSPEQILNYISFIAARRLANEGGNEREHDIENFGKLIQRKRDLHQNLKKSLVGPIPTLADEPAIISLLSRPAVLNIALGMAKKLDGKPPSYEHLLDTYHVFVAERGSEFRSLAPTGVERIVDRGDFLRILAAISWLGFYIATEDGRIPLDKLRGKIEEWVEEVAEFKEAKTFIAAALQGAVDCNLIKRDEFQRDSIEFTFSHDLMLSYYAGRFVELTTNTLAVIGPQRRTRKSIRLKGSWADKALFRTMLKVPTLGAAQGAIYHYLQRVARSDSTGFQLAAHQIQTVADQTRVPHDDAGIPAEQIHEILPGHKIVAWRVLGSLENQKAFSGHRIEELHISLSTWLREQYKHTSFEYVFEAILRNCYPLLKKDASDMGEDFWRFSNDFSDLRQGLDQYGALRELERWIENPEFETPGAHKKLESAIRVIRRCIYMTRYFQTDWSGPHRNAMIDWMKYVDDLVRKTNRADQKPLQCLHRAIKSSVLHLEQNEASQKHSDRERAGSKWLADLIASAWDDSKKLDEHRDELAASRNVEEFFGIYCQTEKDSGIESIEHLYSAFYPPQATSQWHPKLAALAIDRLADCQKKSASPSPEATDLALEAKLCHLVLGLGQSSYYRPLFLPDRYSLSALGVPEIDSAHADHDGKMLKLLFNGAARPLRKGESTLVNATSFSVGEFQLYDYYTRAIWSLLGDNPQTILGV